MEHGNLLAQLLGQARKEGALEGPWLESFMKGFQERVAIVLERRLDSLRAENRHKVEAVAARDTQIEWLGECLREAQAQARESAEAHERLLAHHRDVLRFTVERLDALIALSPADREQACEELRALADSLRAEKP